MARRHGLTPQQLFTWRREARQRMEAETLPAFVPAVLVEAEPMAAKKQKRRGPRPTSGAIEIEASGVTVRCGDGASPATITAVIRALKGAP
ncbi:transposase [Camelimonas lactis]|uniref:Transposase n=1 Tax=Camelimonas lactis TaxID=659006 RepID=A0A4V2RVY4_9HYPH|nr:transposase [Camelimonas lactis]